MESLGYPESNNPRAMIESLMARSAGGRTEKDATTIHETVFKWVIENDMPESAADAINEVVYDILEKMDIDLGEFEEFA